jgi:hypothetical protein
MGINRGQARRGCSGDYDGASPKKFSRVGELIGWHRADRIAMAAHAGRLGVGDDRSAVPRERLLAWHLDVFALIDLLFAYDA